MDNDIAMRNAAVRLCRTRSDIESFLASHDENYKFLPGITGEDQVGYDAETSMLVQVDRLEQTVRALSQIG